MKDKQNLIKVEEQINMSSGLFKQCLRLLATERPPSKEELADNEFM